MNPKVKGIIAILISAIGFSFMSVFFRLAGDLPVFQKSLARNLVSLFIPLFFIYKYILFHQYKPGNGQITEKVFIH